jgi:lysophospholipase L1-like esterase
VVFNLALIGAWNTCAQQDADTNQANPPVVFTTQQDHQNMRDQLGIKQLRPGRSPRADSPNAANYDEATANPYPELPEILKTAAGQTVDTPELWWTKRRPEIVELLESELYGRIPKNVPHIKWEVRQVRDVDAGGKPAIQKELVGVVDNSACPDIQINISMSLTLPKEASGPVPVLISFGWTPFDLERGNFGGVGRRGAGPRPPSKQDKLIAAGWGCAMLNPSTVQDDSGGWQPRRFGPGADPNAKPTGAGLTRGIIGLTNLGQPRKPDQWGALRAWAWAASRAVDYLESVPEVDSQRVGIAGVSRYGKAALVAMAFDQRFAMGLIASSGAGGTKLYRRNFGESLENLATSGGYHWMAGNYLKYSADESSFGRQTAADLPVDSHMTIALCAPRLVFISHGVPEKGDAHWLDHQGSFMAAIAAQPVFRLLGARDLGRGDDVMKEKMPAVNVDMLDGALAWRQHDGGHTDDPNVEHFVRWAQTRWDDASRTDHAAIPRPDENSRRAHEELLRKTKQGRIDVYFQGDSITRRWGATDYPSFLAHWKKSFHGWNAANFAWGGDTTHNILWRLRNGELDGVSPKVVVLQAGTNNLPWRGAADDVKVGEVFSGIRAIVDEFQKRVPNGTIILTAVFPRTQNMELAPTINKINERIETLADGKRIRFVNINDQIADSTGRLLPGVSSDGLHLEEPGYEIWAQALTPIFTELLGPPAEVDLAPPPTGDPSAAR